MFGSMITIPELGLNEKFGSFDHSFLEQFLESFTNNMFIVIVIVIMVAAGGCSALKTK